MSHEQSGEQLFLKFEQQVQQQNFYMLKSLVWACLIISIIISSVLLVAQILLSSVFIYLIWILLSTILLILCKTQEKFIKKHATVVIYGFLFIIIVLAIVSGTFLYPHGTSAVVIGFLAILPFSILDRIDRFCAFEISIALLFCACSILAKDLSIAIIDCVNAISFGSLGCFLGGRTIKLKLLNMESKAIIEKQRDTDSLTGLTSRGTAENVIQKLLLGHHRESAFILLDIDNFKMVNDTFGHTYGDKVLIDTAHILRETMPEADCIARLGGDEFLIFVKDIPDRVWLKNKAQELNHALDRDVENDGYKIKISASIGIALYIGIQTFEILYMQADKALYKVKAMGKNQYFIFSEAA